MSLLFLLRSDLLPLVGRTAAADLISFPHGRTILKNGKEIVAVMEMLHTLLGEFGSLGAVLAKVTFSEAGVAMDGQDISVFVNSIETAVVPFLSKVCDGERLP
jgi:hypothetical protein